MRFAWGEELGRPECPYLHRWVADFGVFTVKVHHFLRSDDNRNLHDHPWWYWTVVLKGNYRDVGKHKTVNIQTGQWVFRSALHQHTVQTTGVWTLVVTGPQIRKWGFWVKGKFRKANKYFLMYGHHPCDQP